MAEQSVTLQPGESKLVSFEATPTKARTYQVSVNGLTGSFKATIAVTYYCPYCGGASTSLDEFLTHIRSVHFPVPEDYYFCNYCGAEFGTLDGLLDHFISEHLDKITASPPAITVYAPDKVIAGTQFEVTHVFSLKIKGYGDQYTAVVELKRKGSRDYRVSGVIYVDPRILSACPVWADRMLPLDHDGEYIYTSVRKAPEDKGTYSIWSVAKYQHISMILPGCGLRYDQEYTIWNQDTGKKLTVV
ncbi:hypothetical protein ES705_35451 [subsurface metagenome]